jgi:hypothetical protein
MTCSRCRKKIESELTRCPHCGNRATASSGTFQVSSVLISTGGSDRVYRSVDEVPAGLRTRLLKSTNSPNSATILIADRRGRKEIARAVRKLPGPGRRRLARAVLAADPSSEAIAWLTPGRRAAIMAVIAAICLALIAFVFTHRWNR